MLETLSWPIVPVGGQTSVLARRTAVSNVTGTEMDDLAGALDRGGLETETADKFVENVLGTYALPFGVIHDVRVNGRDYVAPMVVEEPSLLAAAAGAAKMIRNSGGFLAEIDPPLMVSQVQLTRVKDPRRAEQRILERREELLALADDAIPGLVVRGGGARDLEVRHIGTPSDAMLVIHIVVDCQDAMGANLVNGVAEAVGDRLAELAHAEVGLRILSNLCDKRKVRLHCSVSAKDLATAEMDGSSVIDGIVSASRFAELDPYRAATHNKAIMNGIDAVVMATGNDWRAVEAGAHAFAAQNGSYGPLAIWQRNGERLDGRLELPMAVGTVGGTLRVHRAARLALRLLGVPGSGELSAICAAVGLASNLAAVHALVLCE